MKIVKTIPGDTEIDRITRELHTLIRRHDFITCTAFINYMLDNGMLLEYRIARKNSFFFRKYIESRRRQAKNRIVTFGVDGR